MVLSHVFCNNADYLFVPQFTSPVAAFIWTADGESKNLPFCCFIREDILEEIKKKIITTSYQGSSKTKFAPY